MEAPESSRHRPEAAPTSWPRRSAYPDSSEFALSRFLSDQEFALRGEINDAKARRQARIFEIKNVCPLVEGFSPRDFRQILQPYELRPTENLPYPSADMRTALLDNRTKPPKTVLVLPDAPKDTFYVATLIDRQMKTMDEFHSQVYSFSGSAQSIRVRYYDESMKRSRESALDLLKKEFRYEVTEEQKKKLEEGNKSGEFSE